MERLHFILEASCFWRLHPWISGPICRLRAWNLWEGTSAVPPAAGWSFCRRWRCAMWSLLSECCGNRVEVYPDNLHNGHPVWRGRRIPPTRLWFLPPVQAAVWKRVFRQRHFPFGLLFYGYENKWENMKKEVQTHLFFTKICYFHSFCAATSSYSLQ